MAIVKYDLKWPDTHNDLLIELDCFREDMGKFINPEQRPFHFKNIVSTLWGPKSTKPFIWNPWADQMLINACKYQYLSLSGCAGCGKSTFAALWALVNWLSLPGSTTVMVTSTSLEEARGRIWGDIEAFFNAGNESLGRIQKGVRLPGRMLGSVGKIRTQDGNERFDEKCGIRLISGDRTKEKDNIGKLIGFHNKRVILIADELPELSPALVEAAKSNLAVNPHFQMVGIGNFASIYDPFGTFSEPKGGWATVSPDYDSWETREGFCLRFDGLKSPNVLLGIQKYPGMYGPENLASHREDGEHTAKFWRMCRSFPCPETDVDRIFQEADLLKADVRSLVKWREAPVRVAALDPAFVTGGDLALATFGECGISVDGKRTLQIIEQKELREDVRKKDESRALQVAKLFRAECERRGIAPKNCAFDLSGGGIVFGTLLTEIWSRDLLGVQFGGAASERPASIKDKRPAAKVFKNRVTELWFAGVDFVNSGQIKGLPSACCVELTERRKHKSRQNVLVENRVESKSEMKLRTGGKSCDRADSFIILLELCRVRLGFSAEGMEGGHARARMTWKQRVMRANAIYGNVDYAPEEMAA